MIIDLQDISTNLIRRKFEQDERRIGLFVSAVGKKLGELAVSDPDHVQPFAIASSVLIAQWIQRARKFQFPKDLFNDPFKQLRQDTREFAAVWNLDPVFIKAMGS